MKKLTSMISLAALSLASIQVSAAEVSANVALTSDYKFRGISQSDTSPAIQGGFDLEFENGLYVGTWASNVDFANSLELDYYGGYATDINDDVSIDVGYLYYDYPGSPDADDYAEVYASVGFKDLTVGVNYSDDYYLETGKFIYLYAGYEFSLPNEISLAVHYGFNDFDRSTKNARAGEGTFLQAGADSYADYNITVSKSFSGVDFSLGYYDTDLNDAECGNTSICDGSFIFTIAKEM